MAASDDAARLREFVGTFAGLRLGNDTWCFRSVAQMVLEIGMVWMPSPWPGDRPQWRPGRCFDAATEYADATQAIYVEGFVLVPGLTAWPVFEHAWCLRDGKVADPSLPDGHAALYLGIALAPAFRAAEQARRATCAVLLPDPSDFRVGDNEQVLRWGLPEGAVSVWAGHPGAGALTP
ncbi:hypothetical protein [Kitasatospora purpeofusca]|uniref:hypothetical protein n=1 Tax=Kitasatospora purpeofusca TaxID=67352 RepID=UPI0035D58133